MGIKLKLVFRAYRDTKIHTNVTLKKIQKVSYFRPEFMPKIPVSETPNQKLDQELAKPSRRKLSSRTFRKWATLTSWRQFYQPIRNKVHNHLWQAAFADGGTR